MAKRDPNEPFETPDGPWQERVAYSATSVTAFRPNELIVQGDEALGRALEIIADATDGADLESFLVFDKFQLIESSKPFDVERVAAQLASADFVAEPNVVFFNHGASDCGCCGGGIGGNPFNSNPFNSNPFNSNPFNSNPFNSNPFNSNPFNSNPFNSNGWATNGERPSSARPAPPTKDLPDHAPGAARAIVMDTGIATKRHLPTKLKARPEHNDADAADREKPDLDGNKFLDASAGHGTFIAGIIEQLAPNHHVRCARVLGNLGDGDAASIAKRLDVLLPTLDPNTIINMSFGSYGDPKLYLLSAAIERAQRAGAVVVASAGNDGTCMRSYPAALPDVVSVGSIDASGAAHYSNWGAWVRACAPGTDVTSLFFAAFNGNMPDIPGVGDPDHFKGWARWTGTSFAAPIVVAALMRHMAIKQVNAAQAVEAIIDAPSLGRFPGLGTVINLVPGM